MGVEIERKFLVTQAVQALLTEGTEYQQGYLAENDRLTVRARLAGDAGRLTIKSAGRGGAVPVRAEFEYEVPAEDVRSMLDTLVAGPVIRKTRYRLQHGAHLWEVDVFAGDNAGLIVAEIELSAVDEDFERPSWLAEEVTEDPRYLNVNLAKRPYSQW